MFLKLEDNRLINLDLVGEVELNEHDGNATLFAAGVLLAAKSKIAYKYFSDPDLQAKIKE